MSISDDRFAWAIPVMRAGYAGRGLVYLVLAGFSLFAIWRGGRAQGTGSALNSLESSVLGQAVLGLIAAGLLAYALWRVVDAIRDLEEYGTGGKGLIARAGMVTTGLLHGGLGIAAAVILFVPSGGDGSTIAQWTGRIMSLPAGRAIVGLAGLATVGAGAYYAHKALSNSFQQHLQANPFTRRWNLVLKAGVLAQAVMVTVVGGFLVFAALTADPGQAGGAQQVFDFLGTQPFGNVLVLATVVGLLCFAVFCFVNAAYRVVPKVKGGDIESLADWA